MSLPPKSPSRNIGRPPAGAGRLRIPLVSRRWLTAFVGLFLLGAAWAFASPYDGTPDEMQHVIRASGVVHGDIAPKGITFESRTPGRVTITDTATGAEQTVARGLIRENCWAFSAGRPASCAKAPGGDDTLVQAPTRAGRYNPVYYLLVGWPLALSPDWTGIMGARLLSLALTSGLLAAALVAATTWTRRRLMAAGVITAITPITMHMSGAVNPSGLEIAAGLALFATLTPVLLDPDEPVRRPAMVVALVSALALVTMRALGPAWLLLALLVLVLPNGRAALRRLWASRPARLGALAIVAAAVVGGLWTVLMKVNEAAPRPDAPQIGFFGALKAEVVLRWGDYMIEMVGRLSWLDTTLPTYMYFLWYAFVGALLIPALLFGTRVDRLRLLGLLALVFAVPTVSDAIGVNKYGFMAQGRYVLPIAVGLPIIAAFVVERLGLLDPARVNRVTRVFAVVLLPSQLVFLAWTMIRWQSGISRKATEVRVNPLNGPWHPPAGSVLPLVLGACGVAVLIWFTMRVTRPAATGAARLKDLETGAFGDLRVTA